MSIDLSIFTNLESHECAINECSDDIIDNCDYLKRIGVGLKYYQFVGDSQIEEEQFTQFCQNIYTIKTLLNDYYHLIKQHNTYQQLIAIKQGLKSKYLINPCQIKQCDVVLRHYRLNKTDKDTSFSFYTDCFDRFHHQIFHLEQMGLIQDTKDILIDDAFKLMKNRIFQKRKDCGLDSFDRFQSTNNKFNVINFNNTVTNRDESGITFTDAFLDIINDDDNKLQLQNFIISNDYDSESIMDDLQDIDSSKSNLYNLHENALNIDLVSQFIQNHKCMLSTSSAFF